MKRKILPTRQPPLMGYLFYMYPMSILANSDRYLPWFYSHFIQLFYLEGAALKFYIHPFCTTHRIRDAFFSA